MGRIGLLVLLMVIVGTAQEPGAEEGWPLLLKFDDGARLVLHPPQIEDWKDFERLDVLLAATIELPGAAREAFGTVRLRAVTKVDIERGVALIEQPEVVAAEFPGLKGEALARAKAVVEHAAQVGAEEVALADLIPGAAGAGVTAEVAVANTPPKMFLSSKAALLIVFDGEPAYVPIEGTDLSLALNTPSLLFKHENTGWHYLFGWGNWIKARDLKSKWASATKLPSTFAKLPDEPLWSTLKKYIPGKPLKKADVPDVFVSTEPAEAIVTFGEDKFEPVPGTKLLYLANTESDVFLDQDESMYYWLVSGRWFRTASADEPLEFCTDKLPADFRKIPADHPTGRVRSSVPGTPDAAEAVFVNRLPRRATLPRGAVQLDVSANRFTPVKGAQGVEWAADADLDVFRVAGAYYACSDGLWFKAAKSSGKYELADAVPEAIYAIPSRHPGFSVTFVRVAASNKDAITFVHTAGYYGSYVSNGVVVYGTGYETPVTPAALRRSWDNRKYWLERWNRPELFAWHRSLTYGQGRWFDDETGLFRVGFEAMSHAAIRTAPSSAYRTWRGKAVLPAAARVIEPKAEKKPTKRVAKAQAEMYAGPKGEVYKRQGDEWFKQKHGRWVHLSKRPGLKGDKPPKLSQEYIDRQRAKQRRRTRRNARDRRGGYGRGWGWCGGGLDVAVGVPAGGLALGGW